MNRITIFNKSIQLKVFIPLLFIVLLLTSSITYMLVSSSLPVVIISSGMNVEGYSYVVFKDGSLYYAKNGLTGALGYGGSDFQIFCDAVITGVSSEGGGTIFFKGAEYLVKHRVTMKSNVNLIGEGYRTHWYLPPSQPYNVGSNDYTSQHYALLYGSDIENVTVSTIRFDGSYGQNNTYALGVSGAIYIEDKAGGSSNVNIEHCFITDTAMNGILVQCTSGTTQNINARWNTCIRAYENSIAYGMQGGTVSRNHLIEGNDISVYSDIGIAVSRGSGGYLENVIIANNKIHNAIDGYGTGAVGHCSMTGIYFEANVYNSKAIGNSISGVRNGILTMSTAHSNSFIGNTIQLNVASLDGNDGIGLFGSYNLVANNIILGGYDDACIAYNVNTACWNSTLIGNVATQESSIAMTGFVSNSGAVGITFIGNRCTKITGTDYWDNGTGAKFKSNQESSNAWYGDV